MNDLILYTTEAGELDAAATVKDCLAVQASQSCMECGGHMRRARQ